jgi:HEAT repeat protein
MGQDDRLHTGDEPSLGGPAHARSRGQEPRVGGDRALLHLAEMLGSKEPDIRDRAVFALAELGDERALAHLLAIMQDSSQPWGVRERAAYAVGPIGQAAVPHLFSLLGADWNIYGKNLAAISLGTIARQHPLLVDSIVQTLIEGQSRAIPGMRAAVIQAMGRVGDPAFVPYLLEVLGSEPGRLGECAAESLGMLGEKSRMPEVVDMLFERMLGEHDKRGSPSIYAEALARIGDSSTIPRALALMEHGEERVAAVLDQLVEGVGEAATPHLLQALARPDYPYRSSVIAALGFTRDRRAVEALLTMLDEMGHRATVIEALGMLRDPLALPRLIELLNSPSGPPLAARILWALGVIGDAGIAPALLSYIESHTAGSLIAIRMLGSFRYVPAVPYLIDRLSHKSARAHAITALVLIGTPEALSAIARLVNPQELAALPENFDPDVLGAIDTLRDEQGYTLGSKKGHPE